MDRKIFTMHNSKHKEAGMAILMSDDIVFKTQNIIESKRNIL